MKVSKKLAKTLAVCCAIVAFYLTTNTVALPILRQSSLNNTEIYVVNNPNNATTSCTGKSCPVPSQLVPVSGIEVSASKLLRNFAGYYLSMLVVAVSALAVWLRGKPASAKFSFWLGRLWILFAAYWVFSVVILVAVDFGFMARFEVAFMETFLVGLYGYVFGLGVATFLYYTYAAVKRISNWGMREVNRHVQWK